MYRVVSSVHKSFWGPPGRCGSVPCPRAASGPLRTGQIEDVMSCRSPVSLRRRPALTFTGQGPNQTFQLGARGPLMLAKGVALSPLLTFEETDSPQSPLRDRLESATEGCVGTKGVGGVSPDNVKCWFGQSSEAKREARLTVGSREGSGCIHRHDFSHQPVAHTFYCR